jgi:UDP-N-acetylglucosamine 2-epimerase
MLTEIEAVLLREQPDAVIVYGDTNSTLAGALAAAKMNLPLVHVEAGLRSFNRTMPEEINRVVTDHLSTRLFCPTDTAAQHLAREGITEGVTVVGDVMFDVLLQMRPRLTERAATLLPSIAAGLEPQHYLLMTVHRPANTDQPEPLQRVAHALAALRVPVIFPVHPRTRTRMAQYDLAWPPTVTLTEPASYLDMLTLQQHAACVVTDSGGVQKEAFLLGVPCITLRDETEWPETVSAGWNTLVGTREEDLLAALQRPKPAAPSSNPFGDGRAAEHIAQALSVWPSEP